MSEDDVIEEARAWKRDLGIPERREGMDSTESLASILDRVARIAEKGKERYAEIRALMDEKIHGCKAMVREVPDQGAAVEVAGCQGLMGYVRVYGVSEACARKSLDCWAGRLEYQKGAEGYLRELQMGPNYMGAHFFGHGFVWDSLSKAAYRFANEPGLLLAGESLILGGTTGPGKTYSALAIACHAKMKHGWSDVMFIDACGLLEWSSKQEALVERARVARLLIIDDLGTERHTEKTNGMLYRIINRRLEMGYPTVITCNMNEGDFFEAYHEARLKDRLKTYKMMFTNLPSKRQKPMLDGR